MKTLDILKENKATANAIKKLDSVDLMPYIQSHKGKEVKHLMGCINHHVLYSDEYSDSVLELLTEEEFFEYLLDRYGEDIVGVEEVIKYRVK